ncbi:hypothetical protein Trichorick_01386 (plasmid) [Candidatus Trichorickettsia mobilis]|uniref:CopG family transcriptional regulator n=1 Tax=Candidatus Trichorickettsia mobilis TaxID=1346319 RepID=A0ABZ0UTV2_9RICK|nr:hypothetical protein [Candidatus Trichorickettsia mobilis]WPY01473.1 hypothetical protein Trichorick_01386 [Candidatus Trichorickettsia mobilis]
MNKSRFSLDVEEATNAKNVNNDVDKKALKAFAKAAITHTIDIKQSNESWKEESPDALPDYNFRLRLNKYQIGLVKYVAKIEKRSLSNLVKSILLNELERRLKEER